MTTPVLEDDVVERLRAEKIDLRIPEMPFCTERVTRPVCEEAASLIEQQRKTIEELRGTASYVANELERHYSSMSPKAYPGPPTSLIEKLRALLQGDKKE